MENNLESKSTKVLEGSLKGLKIISTALVIVIGLLLAITIYGMLFKDDKSTFVSLFAVGVCCSAVLPLQFSSMNKIKKELKTREK